MTAIKREVTIGNCRLILGNCLEVMKELGPVDHIITDSPYEQEMHDSHKRSEFRRKDGGSKRRKLDFEGIDAVRPELLQQVDKLCDGWFLTFSTAEGVGAWKIEVKNTDLKYKTTCIWVKPDCAPKFNGEGPAIGFEPFITCWAGEGPAKWNAGGKRGVYTHNTNSKFRDGRHPTEKPAALMGELLRDFTNEGQTILDPFMGSGTTGVACVHLRRQFIGIEQSEKYFEIAVERIKAAKHDDLLNQSEQLSFIEGSAA